MPSLDANARVTKAVDSTSAAPARTRSSRPKRRISSMPRVLMTRARDRLDPPSRCSTTRTSTPYRANVIPATSPHGPAPTTGTVTDSGAAMTQGSHVPVRLSGSPSWCEVERASRCAVTAQSGGCSRRTTSPPITVGRSGYRLSGARSSLDAQAVGPLHRLQTRPDAETLSRRTSELKRRATVRRQSANGALEAGPARPKDAGT